MKVCPFPSTTLATNFLSIVLAATVTVHGATLVALLGSRPPFPAEFTVKIPFLIAWNDPIAMGSSKYSRGGPPRDTDKISTPSAIASSNAANISADEHPNDQQALYTAILALGAPPRAVPLARLKKLAFGTWTLAAAEAVWDPWPTVSLGELMLVGGRV